MSIRGLSRIPVRKIKTVKSNLLRIRALLQQRRLALGMTQEELAERLEISHSMLSSIEAGVRIPSLPMLLAIADELGLQIIPK